MAEGSSTKLLVMDTNAWLFYCGLGPAATADIIRCIVGKFRSLRYRLAYTDVTLVEVKKSPRPEIIEKKDAIIRCIRRNGLKVGPSYLKLTADLEYVPGNRREDAAIALAASDNLLLTMDAWLAQYRLVLGLTVIYLPPRI